MTSEELDRLDLHRRIVELSMRKTSFKRFRHDLRLMLGIENKETAMEAVTDTNGRVETAEEFAAYFSTSDSTFNVMSRRLEARDATIEAKARADQRKTTAGEVLDRVSFKIHSEYTYTGADVLQALGDLRREYAQETKMDKPLPMTPEQITKAVNDAEAFHGIANETGRSEFVKAAKAAEEAFGEDATDPLGSETWDQLRASIAELEAQLAAERERAEKAERRADGCESNGPHSRQSLMQSLNLARDHEAALLAERDALREAVRVLGNGVRVTQEVVAERPKIEVHVNGVTCKACGAYTFDLWEDDEGNLDMSKVTHYRDCIRSRYDQACKDINANPIASAAIAGEETA